VHTTALAVADADLDAAEVVLPDADEVRVAVGAPVPERVADPDPDDEAVPVGAAGCEAALEGEALPDPPPRAAPWGLRAVAVRARPSWPS
jgi:hypothetical protein